jgi:hypothetical protein
MIQKYERFSMKELNAEMNKISIEIKSIENKYKSLISEKLRYQLLVIYNMESNINRALKSLEQEDISCSFLLNNFLGQKKTKEFNTNEKERIESLASKFRFIDLNQFVHDTPSGNQETNIEEKYPRLYCEDRVVDFCTYGESEPSLNAVPISVNVRALKCLIPEQDLIKTPSGELKYVSNIEEVISKLLPFMSEYSSQYENLCLSSLELDIESDCRRDAIEGEEHLNFLLSEYGEDIFPDRD